MRIPDQSVQMRFRVVRRRFTGRYRRAVGPIEVVALLNVALLAAMMWAAWGKTALRPGVRVELPEAPFTEGAPPGARVVALTREGLCFFGDARVELGDLEALLRAAGPEGGLLVEADRETPYGVLAEVYGMASRAGFGEVVLATRPPPRAVLPSGRGVPER
ncbi:MAG: hypothetical protein IK066_12565 [Kiritimatiellae bacterium]|nr:hypothetical protein [Kiritimatiellia bacterium]